MNRFCYCWRYSRHLSQLFYSGGVHTFKAAEVAQERLTPGRANTRYGVERRAEALFGTQEAVVGDSEPMGLITHLLEQEQCRGIRFEYDRVFAAREKYPFGR